MSLGVYLFRHIRTRQILVTTEKSVLARPRLLKSQIKPNQRPPRIRPDHWTPLVVALGFKDKKAQANAFMLASMAGHPLVVPTAQEKKAYVLMPNKNKRLAEMDMVERQVAQLARTLMYMDAVRPDTVVPVSSSSGSSIDGAVSESTDSSSDAESAAIKLLWEDKSWISKIEDAGLHWPKWVAHGDLDLKRGNIIMNPEVRQTSQPQ
ncbi:hypothetical protein LPJ72_003956 [Coemansia sp. Benny D160-2]|nr:hypothetical protein LPJ72_003956 [Coemansia sp. Benny D160-2]